MAPKRMYKKKQGPQIKGQSKMTKYFKPVKQLARALQSTTLYNPQQATLTKQLWPSRNVAKFRWTWQSSLTPTSAGALSHVYRANAAARPYGQTAKQPAGYDTFQEIYSRACVVGSRVAVTFLPYLATGTSTASAYAGVFLTNQVSSLPATAITTIETTRGNWAAIPATATQDKTVQATFSAKKFYGVDDPLDNSGLNPQVSELPSTCAYYVVWAEGMNSVAASRIDYMLTMDLTVIFSGPKNTPLATAINDPANI